MMRHSEEQISLKYTRICFPLDVRSPQAIMLHSRNPNRENVITNNCGRYCSTSRVPTGQKTAPMLSVQSYIALPLSIRTTSPLSLEITKIRPKSSVHAAKLLSGERTIDSARRRLSGNPYLCKKNQMAKCIYHTGWKMSITLNIFKV